ncbi:MAG TPA: hypothetical protein DDY17_02400, partial [Syntrophaceae bacterium]|jgi:hypothetical protein|nr:hypothetical protein [Syntrophaceae bacterium]
MKQLPIQSVDSTYFAFPDSLPIMNIPFVINKLRAINNTGTNYANRGERIILARVMRIGERGIYESNDSYENTL